MGSPPQFRWRNESWERWALAAGHDWHPPRNGVGTVAGRTGDWRWTLHSVDADPWQTTRCVIAREELVGLPAGKLVRHRNGVRAARLNTPVLAALADPKRHPIVGHVRFGAMRLKGYAYGERNGIHRGLCLDLIDFVAEGDLLDVLVDGAVGMARALAADRMIRPS